MISSLSRFSRSCRRLGVGWGWMATLTSAQGSEPTSMRFASSTGFDQPTFQAVKTLTFQILEPKPLRATQSPRGLEDCKRRKTLELAAELCEGYSNLPPLTLPLSDSCERGKILLFLASECSPADDTVIRALASFQSTPGRQLNISSRLHSTSLTKLRNAATPPYEEILEFVLKQNAIDGMGLLVALRGDLLNVIRWMKKSANDEECLPHLKDLDSYLLRLFSIWFSPGMLVLKRITYENTAASIIELIARKEAVHQMRSLSDLRTRLDPNSRRVFSLFHPLLPGKPLVFVHVALKDKIPSAMPQVMKAGLLKKPEVATFYSITNAEPGLAGVGLGEFLIKESMKCLGNEFSTLESFVTLSPMPHFRHWLEDKIKQNEDNGTFYDESLLSSEEVRQLQDYSGGNDSDPWESLARVLEDYGSSLANKSSSSDDKVSVEIIRPILMKLASRYLILEKHRGKPLDGVTRFHVGNGAEVHRVNFAADLSKKGVTDSFGMMVNYLYSPERVETNQKEFQLDYRIPASSDVLELLPIATGDSKSRISKL